MRPFSDWKKMCTPGGTKFATRVGMPMPRLTRLPSCSSCAMRRAMTLCGSMSSLRDEVIHDRRRGHHLIGGDGPHGHDMLRIDDDGVGRHRDHGIEVARGEYVGEIAEIVGQERLH